MHARESLGYSDIAALLELEHQQWSNAQAATYDDLHERIEKNPQLCAGSFCADSGKALASIFIQPFAAEKITEIRTWQDCVLSLPTSAQSVSRSLFGISLTSIETQAAHVLGSFFWPWTLHLGWQEIYLGSPMPGLNQALRQDPTLHARAYAHTKRGQLPLDPQLRYYNQKGLTEMLAVLPNYFPHEASLDYGVLIRGSLDTIAQRARSSATVLSAQMTTLSHQGRPHEPEPQHWTIPNSVHSLSH
jgi:hypothetical protein